MLRVAVCDNDNNICCVISEILQNFFDRQSVKVSISRHLNGITLLNEHCRQKYDIMFLDIDMPEMSGFEIASELRKEKSNCLIIFITSHSELVYDSLDFQPFNFIRKNCSIPLEQSIERVTEKVLRQIEQKKIIILEDDVSGRCAVYADEIIYIEGDRHYLKYHVLKKDIPIRVRGTMSECETLFEGRSFVKIHKSYIVNLEFLKKINVQNSEVILAPDDRKLPFSRSCRKALDEKYTLYLRSKV